MYQLKVTLEDISPPIWRRLVVPESLTLRQLHQVLQIAFGWQDYHLHLFEIGDREYAEPGGIDADPERDVRSDRGTRLQSLVLAPGDVFAYQYDFGDSWYHAVEVEAVVREPARVTCLAGARAAPPEDCGGPPGYERLLEALADPDDDEHEDMLDWVGGAFDPEGFDLNLINRQLHRRRWVAAPRE